MSSSQSEIAPSTSPSILSCPWGKKPTTTPDAVVSLADVMSEELARTLQDKEDAWEILDMPTREDSPQLDDDLLQPFPEDLDTAEDTGNDRLLAQLLQMEYDKEHDANLAREERRVNGVSKVSVSYEKFRRLPECLLSSDDDSEDDDYTPAHWDSFEKSEKSAPTIGKSGIARQGNTITTKHDLNVCGRRNACRVMEFPPGISTGDGGGFDMKLNNSVYNQLKVHSMMEGKRGQRLHDKREKSTAEQALDPRTRLLLYKLVNQRLLESVNGCVSTGKESCVFHASGGEIEDKVIPKECAVKVFKTTLNEFKNRDKYIQEDYRFRERFGKQNPRKVIHLWAEKEKHNLTRMRKAGIHCPEVVALKKHVLIMSFIGQDQKPAPKLKDVKLTPQQMLVAFGQTLNMMKRLYTDCHLVHADLSEFNLLWHQERVWVIDVSQSVEPTHPHALEFLFRDCFNISTFFGKQGVPNVSSPKELFHQVSGIQLPGEGAELLSQIQNYERDEEILAHGGISDRMDAFDVLFKRCSEQSKAGQGSSPLAMPLPTAAVGH